MNQTCCIIRSRAQSSARSFRYTASSDSGFSRASTSTRCVWLRELGLKVEREVPYEMIYHGVSVGVFRADLVVEGKVLVEGKTGRLIDPVYLARARNYLCVSKLEVGLMLNFGPSAEFKRLIASGDGRISITA
jgi:GxxExxY protein